MKVDNVIQTDVAMTTPSETLLNAAGSMRTRRVGSLAVVSDAGLVGIITERDMVRAVSDGVEPGTTRVSQYMTADPAVIAPTDDTQDVAQRMTSLGIRHLPVVDEGGRLVGIVSARDIAELEAWPRRA